MAFSDESGDTTAGLVGNDEEGGIYILKMNINM